MLTSRAGSPEIDEAKPHAYSYARMSTLEQRKGDSLRRQIAMSEKYAETQGWKFVPEGRMQDIGISAFRGANVRDGALGSFLKAMDEGKIKKGSYLIVESFDRLSRQEVNYSLSLFLRITNQGINLVTLADNHIYRAGSINEFELMYSLMMMVRAHDESHHKSLRLLAVWDAKRAHGTKKRLTAKCPFWLRPSSNGTSFEIKPDAVAVVRRMFADSIAGLGTYAIISRLNAERIPTFAKSEAWAKSTISKLLQDRSVLGEYQPHRLTKERKREPVGNPIKGYFPSIISESDFELAQSKRLSRKTGGAGRKGKAFSNLFGKLAVCGECNSRMHYVNKGRPPKGGTYLICSAAQKHRCANKIWVPYQKFEKDFLTHVGGIDISSLFDRGLLSDEEKRSAAQLHQALAKRTLLSEQEQRLIDLVADGKIQSETAKQKLLCITADLRELDALIVHSRAEVDRIGAEKRLADVGSEEMAAAIERLQGNSEDQYRLRAEAASRIAALIEKVSIRGPAESSDLKSWVLQNRPSRPSDNISETVVQECVRFAAAVNRYLRPSFEITYADGEIRWLVLEQSVLNRQHQTTQASRLQNAIQR